MSDLAAALLILVLLFFTALVGASEAALLIMSRSRAKGLAEEHVPGAEKLEAQMSERGRFISPLLFVGLAGQLVMAALLAYVVERRWGSGWIPLAVAIQIVVTFVLAEAAPKIWALRNIDQAAVFAARVAGTIERIVPVRWVSNALYQLARVLLGRSGARRSAPVATEEEIVALADAAVAADVLDDSEGEIIQAIVDFGDTVVREAMIARPDMLAICLAWGPNIPAGTRWPQVRSIDIAPTVLDLLGLPAPDDFPGRSLIRIGN